MPQDYNNHSDTAIILMLVQNNQSAWDLLYDKYGPMMYGTILKMAGNKKIAGEIFKDVLRDLKDKKILSRSCTALCHRLLRHTYKLTLKHLEEREIEPASYKPLNGSYPLINLLCFKVVTLKEAAIKSDISEDEVPKKLRVEFKRLRAHSKQKTSGLN